MNYETCRGGEILSAAPSLKYYGVVAYLNPGPFSSAEADGEERFKDFIDSSFADINSRDTKCLVVDLRNNSGGHNAYIAIVLIWQLILLIVMETPCATLEIGGYAMSSLKRKSI
ncbi:S41 family peptidase [Pontibacter flavimaris]|uniref:Uncharacterized protein n=1 Tax=Pontibacter flavimaris TaxID=1797110 RepID=A0A1Q5P8D3_9BACT|nr:S41 family peptidase [Pontibacter flavimaris]OKL38520.1 hypothetical protein A3841_05025 [Pontibacter flavimaris]